MRSSTVQVRKGMLARIAFGLALLVLGAQALAAGTAANTILQNTVTVKYDSTATSGGAYSTTASVSITVNLVKAAPLVSYTTSPSATGSSADLPEGSTVTFTYQLTSQANGPDTYTVTPSETLHDSNLSASTFTPSSQAVPLGATTVGVGQTLAATCLAGAGSPTDCNIVVPNDTSTTSTTSVNGIANGYVAIAASSGTIYCQVASATNPGNTNPYSSSNHATLAVTGCGTSISDVSGTVSITTAPSSPVLANGDSIYQTAFTTISAKLGTLTSPVTSDYTTIAGAVTNTNSPADSATIGNQVVYVYAPTLNIHKFVRDVTTTANNPTACSTTTAYSCLNDGTNTYYASGVKATPGDTLQYVVLIENAGSVKVDNVIATDPIEAFTYYLTKTIQLVPSTTVTASSCSSGTCTFPSTLAPTTVADDTLTTANDFGGVSGGTAVTGGISGGTVTVYAGTGGNEAASAGGSVSAGSATVVYYEVKVQ